jgi:hypothetical protein
MPKLIVVRRLSLLLCLLLEAMHQLKNQAINKTEGLVNDKANKFLNIFGAGRSEVSINGMNTGRLNYSIKTIQPISELNTNSKALTFFQGGIERKLMLYCW